MQIGGAQVVSRCGLLTALELLDALFTGRVYVQMMLQLCVQ